MKFNKLMMSAAACALLASCSSDEPAVNNNNGAESPDGNYYISFNIAMPGGAAGETRADVDLNNGAANEYAVDDTHIYIYEISGNDEKNARFVMEGTRVDDNNFEADGTNDVTSKQTIVAKVSGISKTKTYGALVILNASGLTKLPDASMTFGQWMETVQTNSMTTGKGENMHFTMTNAASYDGEGVKVLAPVNTGNIHATQAAAEADDAATTSTIYVQRGVAKVQVKVNAGATSGFEPGKDYSATEVGENNNQYKNNLVTFQKWCLDITNKKAFGVTKALDSWPWATQGYFYEKRASYFNRVYWGVDPNYDNVSYNTYANAKGSGDFTYIEDVTKIANTMGTGVEYCLENTFNTANQYQPQTTRILLKATYLLSKSAAAVDFYRLNTVLYNNDDMAAQIKKVAALASGVAESAITVTMKTNTLTSGKKSLNDICTINGADMDVVAKGFGLTGATDASIDFFNDGVCYYEARIRHFADDIDEDKTPSWTSGAYDADKHLGRYGVVRNNWYELSVDMVSGPGSPTIPDPKDEPDDEEEQYVKCSIKILKWAKRTQSVKL